ncbi:hypothetical protein [Singulisphaera sp. PoT]|uniref:hypothetical protein n=1 Tax=Singulisphaera sp. PoT TaxID=3411797 RepID=UPI003BF545D5
MAKVLLRRSQQELLPSSRMQATIDQANTLVASEPADLKSQLLGELASELDRVRRVASEAIGDARGKLGLVRLIISDPKAALEKVKALEPGNTSDDAMMIDLMNMVTNSAAKIKTNRMLARELRTLRGQVSVIVTDDDGEAD